MKDPDDWAAGDWLDGEPPPGPARLECEDLDHDPPTAVERGLAVEHVHDHRDRARP